jgi:hypothetical protein
VLLDDVQYSKGSYTNRVQIARAGEPVWLTVPVMHRLGIPISTVTVARSDWARAHLDTLKQAYRKAAHFSEIWPRLEGWLSQATGTLAEINSALIRAIAERLDLKPQILNSSDLSIAGDLEADERLARIVAHLAPGGSYLSGSGGAKYQAEASFGAHGVRLTYSKFVPVPYDRSGEPFLPGLSIVDALFHLGWERTAELLRRPA